MRATLALAMAFGMTLGAAAQALPFTFQGRLLDTGGVPITDPTVVRFALYAGGTAGSADSGALVYVETETVSPDATGIFSYPVGSSPDFGFQLTTALFATSEPLFLQINVPFDGDALLPRTQLISAPYAHVASALSPVSEEVVIPILGASVLFGGTGDPSDDRSLTFGIRLDNANNLIAADGLLPSSTVSISPSIEITAEILGSLPFDASQRSVLLSYRLNGLESGALRIFEGTHEFGGTGPETFALPLAAAGGDFQAGEAVSWTISRKWDIPSDTLPGSVLLLAGRMTVMSAR